MRLTHAFAFIAALVLSAVPGVGLAQDYPNRVIRMIVPFAPGGAVDLVSRIVGQALSERLKQPVVIENKPGASSNIGMDMVAKSRSTVVATSHRSPASAMRRSCSWCPRARPTVLSRT